MLFVVKCKKASRSNIFYTIEFSINKQLIERVKELPFEDRKWIPNEKKWKLRAIALYSLMKKYKGSDKIIFDFGDEKEKNLFKEIVKKQIEERRELKLKYNKLQVKKREWVEYKKHIEKNYSEFKDVIHENLNDGVELYPYQIAGTMFLNEVKNVLLAFDMGLGKTLISIALCELNKFNKVFVITPNSLKFNYYNEVEKFTKSKAHVVKWKENKYSIEESKYIIVNYEFFASNDKRNVKKKWDDLNISEIDCLIADESHRLKSSNSATFKNFSKIFKDDLFKNKNPYKIFMSGTPAPSKAYELYTVLNQISPIEFTTKTKFYEYYCGLKYDPNGFGYDYNLNETKFEELFNKISPFTYRKKKKDVLKNLPDKTYQKIYLEMTSKESKVYNDIEEGVANEFLNENINNPMAISIMGKLREYLSHLKVNNIKELINSVIETGEKIVVVDYYKKNLNILHDMYKEISGLHTGDFKDYERSEVVKKFQDDNDKLKIFLGTESTTKEGLTLTAASKMGILTIPYVPGVLDQLSDRLARIGQKNAVNIYIFIYKNTIDEYVFDLIESKRGEISQVIDGEKYVSSVENSIIDEIIKIIKNKHHGK